MGKFACDITIGYRGRCKHRRGGADNSCRFVVCICLLSLSFTMTLWTLPTLRPSYFYWQGSQARRERGRILCFYSENHARRHVGELNGSADSGAASSSTWGRGRVERGNPRLAVCDCKNKLWARARFVSESVLRFCWVRERSDCLTCDYRCQVFGRRLRCKL